MSRLSIWAQNKAQETVGELYKDMERRVNSGQPGLCPVDLAASFLRLCHAQSCGKCVPCRVGLGQLGTLLDDVLAGRANPETLGVIEQTAQTIYDTADCAIGSEAAALVLKGLKGFRDDYMAHILHGRCAALQNQPVPCVGQCPAHVDIPGYIALIRAGRYADAVALIRKDNPLPAACGLICEHPCEAQCRRAMVDGPINIRGLKRYAVEHEGEIPAPKRAEPTGKRVAVVGGGPSGLTCAYYLSIMGHAVTVFEQRKRPGGMLRYGIPSYRLPRETLDREIEGMLKAGFEIKTGVSVGKDISFEALRGQYDAVYLAIGAHSDRKIGIPGEDAVGVVSAVEMLRAIGDGDMPDYTGEDVIVVGGGNVAMDVARSALRCGAEKVTIVYRRRVADMTAQDAEIAGAREEGCELLELHAPVRIQTDENNKVTGLVVQPQIIGGLKWGRPAPRDAQGEEVVIPCDRVMVAIGQAIESEPFEAEGVKTNRGRFVINEDCTLPGYEDVFCGGDCQTGPATVIRAVHAGKVAAGNIDNYLGFHHTIDLDVEIPQVQFRGKISCARCELKEREAMDRRNDFDEVESGFTLEEAMQEASRCLRCDHFGFGAFRGGRIEQW